MIVLDEFTYSFDSEQQVALEWFFRTYIKKMPDSAFKDVIQKIYDDFHEKLIVQKNFKEQVNEF